MGTGKRANKNPRQGPKVKVGREGLSYKERKQIGLQSGKMKTEMHYDEFYEGQEQHE